MNILEDGLVQEGFTAEESKPLAAKMETYIRELLLFNAAYNLVNTDSRDEIIVRHILDSLSAAQQIKQLAEDMKVKGTADPVIADIGSGGGLPGIPLAAAFPQYSFHLVERMSKRCAFLENAAAILPLKNVTVQNLEAERVPHESIDIAVFRAFRPLDSTMIKTLLALLKPNGVLAAYKARKDKITEEMSSIAAFVPDYTIVPLTVPFLTGEDKDGRERNLVLIRKTPV
jgi:16S rRNA (guanine527-N7)-methyltransferase